MGRAIVRRLFSTEEARERGLTRSALAWGERTGRWRRVVRGVYALGPQPVAPLDRARAQVIAAGSAASGALAGVLYGLDGVVLDDRPTRRRKLDNERFVIIEGVPCVCAVQA